LPDESARPLRRTSNSLLSRCLKFRSFKSPIWEYLNNFPNRCDASLASDDLASNLNVKYSRTRQACPTNSLPQGVHRRYPIGAVQELRWKISLLQYLHGNGTTEHRFLDRDIDYHFPVRKGVEKLLSLLQFRLFDPVFGLMRMDCLIILSTSFVVDSSNTVALRCGHWRLNLKKSYS